MGSRSNLGLISALIFAGVERLWHELKAGLLINDQLVQPALWFDGTGLDATAKTATCRQTGTVLSLSGAGSEPDFDDYDPFGGRCLKFNAGKVLAAGDPSFGNISTEDFLFLSMYTFVAGGDYILAQKQSDEGSGWTGWLVRQNNSQVQAQANIRYNGSGLIYLRGSPTNYFDEGAWNFTTEYCDRDEASVNGAGGATWNTWLSGDDPTAVPNCTSPATNFQLGYSSTPNKLALFAMFKKASWFAGGAGGTTEQQAVHKRLASIMLGHELLHNHGATTPTVL